MEGGYCLLVAVRRRDKAALEWLERQCWRIRTLCSSMRENDGLSCQAVKSAEAPRAHVPSNHQHRQDLGEGASTARLQIHNQKKYIICCNTSSLLNLHAKDITDSVGYSKS